jgi:predicted AAA+ superfamily ATPase
MGDTGLLITQTFMDRQYIDNNLYKAVLFNHLDINEGMIMENIVAQMLRANGHKLYFYSHYDKEHRENHMEIDFLITEGKKVVPIDVKSGRNISHVSLDKFRYKFSRKIGNSYVLYTKDVSIKDGIIYLPVYMAMLL